MVGFAWHDRVKVGRLGLSAVRKSLLFSLLQGIQATFETGSLLTAPTANNIANTGLRGPCLISTYICTYIERHASLPFDV